MNNIQLSKMAIADLKTLLNDIDFNDDCDMQVLDLTRFIESGGGVCIGNMSITFNNGTYDITLVKD